MEPSGKRYVFVGVALVAIVAGYVVVQQRGVEQLDDSLEYIHSPSTRENSEKNELPIDVFAPNDEIASTTRKRTLFGLPEPYRLETLERVKRPDGPLVELFASLVEQADKGVADSAMQLGRSLAICSRASRSKAELDSRIAHAEITATDHVFGFPLRDTADYVIQQRRDFEFCDGISDDQINQFARRLNQAAQLGQIEAQYQFLNEIVSIETRRVAYAALWNTEEELISQTIRYLRQSAASGSAHAMIGLGQLALKDQVPGMSKNEAAAYFIAGVAASDAADMPTDVFMLRAERLLMEGSPTDTEEIRELSQQLLGSEKCCVFFEPRIAGE